MQTALTRKFLTNANVKLDTLVMDTLVQVLIPSSSKMTRFILLPVAVLAIFSVNRLKIMITEMK